MVRTGPVTSALEDAQVVAARVVDPELPMLTLADLGVLRSVEVTPGRVRVALAPTYTGCPAVAEMRADLTRALRAAGYDEVRVDLELSPPWSSDDITERGRRLLSEHGLSAPGPAEHESGPVPLRLGPVRRVVTCPRCGAGEATLTSEFGPTACTALYACSACGEPFEHVKEH